MQSRQIQQGGSTLAVGDRVTVWTYDHDPIEITVHRHAVITDLEDHPDGMRYFVGHPPVGRRYGPYSADRLTLGWGR